MKRILAIAGAMAATAFGTGALMAATAVAPAGAAGLIPTKTIVGYAPTSIAQGQGFTVRATVEPLGEPIGLGITPRGAVTFSITNGSTTIRLGSASLPACLGLGVAIIPCTVALTRYPPLTPGPWTVNASYAGDALMGASSGSASLTVADDTFINMCTAAEDTENGGCSDSGSSFDSATGNRTYLYVLQHTDGADNINISFGGPNLSCSPEAPTHGQIADFFTSDTTPTDLKSIRYEVVGPGADTEDARYPTLDAPLCYGSSNDFLTASGSEAPFVNGEYEGLLPFCTEGSPLPCITSESFEVGEAGNDSYEWFVSAPGGDPRMGGAG